MLSFRFQAHRWRGDNSSCNMLTCPLVLSEYHSGGLILKRCENGGHCSCWCSDGSKHPMPILIVRVWRSENQWYRSCVRDRISIDRQNICPFPPAHAECRTHATSSMGDDDDDVQAARGSVKCWLHDHEQAWLWWYHHQAWSPLTGTRVAEQLLTFLEIHPSPFAFRQWTSTPLNLSLRESILFSVHLRRCNKDNCIWNGVICPQSQPHRRRSRWGFTVATEVRQTIWRIQTESTRWRQVHHWLDSICPGHRGNRIWHLDVVFWSSRYSQQFTGRQGCYSNHFADE